MGIDCKIVHESNGQMGGSLGDRRLLHHQYVIVRQNLASEKNLLLPRCRVFGAGGSIGSLAEGDVVIESLQGMTKREDLRNLAIVAHVGEPKREEYLGHLKRYGGQHLW